MKADVDNSDKSSIDGTYLERFTLPVSVEEDIVIEQMARNGGIMGYIDNAYPCGLFAERQLRELDFAPITILYGGNGSGKSTLLNLIARKLQLERSAPYNSSETFDLYVGRCETRLSLAEDETRFAQVPEGSAIITSDDVFDYMLTLRTGNEEVAQKKDDAREAWRELRYGDTIRSSDGDDLELLRMQNQARRKTQSRRQFIRKTAGTEAVLRSNGETALRFFRERLLPDKLYCLDEPENSLSPKLQLQLVEQLHDAARYLGCQLILATHSPFLLALEGARIYDLDASPVDIKPWYELENVRIYAEFFREHAGLF